MSRPGQLRELAARVKRWIAENIVGTASQASYSGSDRARRESVTDGLKDLEHASLDEFREHLPPPAKEMFTTDGRVDPKFAKKTVERAVKWTLEKVVHVIGALIASFLSWLFGFEHGHSAETGGILANPGLARFLERHHISPKTAEGVFELVLPLLVFVSAFAALQIIGFWSWVTGRRRSPPG